MGFDYGFLRRKWKEKNCVCDLFEVLMDVMNIICVCDLFEGDGIYCIYVGYYDEIVWVGMFFFWLVILLIWFSFGLIIEILVLYYF